MGRGGSAEGGPCLEYAAEFRKGEDGTEVFRPDHQVTNETYGSLWDKGQILMVKLEK